jgi:hypothetical protein
MYTARPLREPLDHFNIWRSMYFKKLFGAFVAAIMLTGTAHAQQLAGIETGGAAKSSVRLGFEAVSFGMSLDDLVSLAAARGWKQNARRGGLNQKVTVFPPDGDPIDRYKLGFEAGRLVNIQIEYLEAKPARVEALRAGYPRSKHSKEGWSLADPNGLTLVFIDDSGKVLQALHTGVLRDRTEVGAIFRQALGEAPGGGPPLPPGSVK